MAHRRHMLKESSLLTDPGYVSRAFYHFIAGTGRATLTGSAPQVVHIKLLDDAKRPVGELDLEVDPHGADFQPSTGGTGRDRMVWSTLACLVAQGALC